MGWFGPSKDEVWRQLSQEIGAEYVEGGFWKGKKVQAHVGPWTITLDTHTESSGESSITYTRLRAPYVNPEGFRFTIYRRGIFSDLGKLIGVEDIGGGGPDFDEGFIVNSEEVFRASSGWMDAGFAGFDGERLQRPRRGAGRLYVLHDAIVARPRPGCDGASHVAPLPVVEPDARVGRQERGEVLHLGR